METAIINPIRTHFDTGLTGFGLYVDTCEVTTFALREDSIEVTLPEKADVVVFSGAPGTMIREYLGLFGPAVLPPEWTM